MTVQTESLFAGANLSHRFAALRAHLVESAAKRKIYRTTLNELERLTDRELADLGISRSQIKEIAYQAAYSA